jgi:ribosomal protein S6--L-glutamate ligase
MKLFARYRIDLWVEPRDGLAAVNPTMDLLLRALETAGAATTVRVPEQAPLDLSDQVGPRPDLVLLKTATTFGLTRAAVAEAAGVSFLNSARATIRAHDKAAAAATLAASGIPVPETYLMAANVETPEIPRMSGRWVSKPVRGIHGAGVEFHDHFPRSPWEIDAEPGLIVDDGCRLVQRFVGGEDADVKVYAAGNLLFAAAKPFSPTSYLAEPAREITLEPESAWVAREAGRALGLTCFGVDLRYQHGFPVVIDVNPFPGFRGFPTAVPALAQLIAHTLEVRA